MESSIQVKTTENKLVEKSVMQHLTPKQPVMLLWFFFLLNPWKKVSGVLHNSCRENCALLQLKHTECFCVYIIFMMYWQMNLSFSVLINISITTGFSHLMIVESVSSSWIESYPPNKCGISTVRHLVLTGLCFKQRAWQIQLNEGKKSPRAPLWSEVPLDRWSCLSLCSCLTKRLCPPKAANRLQEKAFSVGNTSLYFPFLDCFPALSY